MWLAWGYYSKRTLFRYCVKAATSAAAAATRDFSSSSNKRLEGKVAVITGGASGLGEVTVREFVKQGARVVIADIDDEMGRRVSESVGAGCSYKRCDVREESEVAGVVDYAMAEYGRLDIMFNNAGISDSGVGPLPSLDLSDFDRTMSINVRGALAGIKHAARAMISSRIHGCILCTGSISGVLAMGSAHPYTVSKHAVIALVKSSASELGQHGIRVNCISPSIVSTPMTRKVFSSSSDSVSDHMVQIMQEANSGLKGVPMLQPLDFANAALFLASDDARFISGHNLLLDAGFTISKPISFPFT